jgi:hypothetical protein
MGSSYACVWVRLQAIELFRYDSTLSDADKARANTTKLPSHLNMAACALKLRDYKTAKEHCDKARRV